MENNIKSWKILAHRKVSKNDIKNQDSHQQKT